MIRSGCSQTEFGDACQTDRFLPGSLSMAAAPDKSSQAMTAAPVGKIEIVQGLRALAVLLVVWTHSIVAASYHSTPKQGTFFHLKSFGACGLDIFFVISGFIVSLVASRAIAQSQSSARTFLSRRFTRIFPLYWILTGVVIVEAQLGKYPILWHRVPWLATLFLLPGWQYPVPPLILSLGWSLVFEIYFYLVLAAWMRLSPRHLIRNTIVFLAGMVTLGTIVGIRSPMAGDLVKSGRAGVSVRVSDRPASDEDGRNGSKQSHWNSAEFRAMGAHVRTVAGGCGSNRALSDNLHRLWQCQRGQLRHGRSGWMAADWRVGSAIGRASAGCRPLASRHAIHPCSWTRTPGRCFLLDLSMHQPHP